MSILLFEIETGEVRELVAAGDQPRYVPTGHLVYGHADGALMGVPFDLETLAVTGPAVTLLPQMDVYIGGVSQFAFSESGTLVYSRGNRNLTAGRRVLWVGRDGSEEAIPVTPGPYGQVRVSPEGRRLLLDIRGFGLGEIRVWDLAARTLARLNLGEGDFMYPVWTPDGTRVAYSEVNSQDIFSKAANNTGATAMLVEDARGNGQQRNPPQLISVAVDTEAASFTFGERGVLMEWPCFSQNEGRPFDISPDGQRFAAIAVGEEVESGSEAEVYIVTDWFEELRARMSGR